MTTVSTFKFIMGADPSQVIDATRRVRFAFTGLQRDLSGFTSKYKQIQSEAIECQTTALRKQAKEIEKLAKETHSANIKKIKEASDYYKKDNIDRYSAEAKRVKSIMALEATKAINLSKASLHQKHLEIDSEKAKQQARIQGLAKERSTMIAVRKNPMADVTGPGMEKIQEVYDKVDQKIQPLIDKSNKKFDNQIKKISESAEKAANAIQKKFVAPQTKSLLKQRSSAMKEINEGYKSQENKEKLISAASVAQGRPEYGKQRLLALKQERDQRKAMVEESFQIEKNKIESTSQFALNSLQKQSDKKIDIIEQNRKKEQNVIGSLSQHKEKALDKEIESHNQKINEMAGFQAETDTKTQKTLLDNLNKTYKEKKKMATDLSNSEQMNIKNEGDVRKRAVNEDLDRDIELFKRRANEKRNTSIRESGDELKNTLKTSQKLKEQAHHLETSRFAWLKQISPIKMVGAALVGLMSVAKSVFKVLFSIPTLIGTVVLFAIGKTFIDTAANMEKLQMALDQLTFGKGQETFLALNKWAKDMPVDTEKAISSFRLMKAYGLDPTLKDMTVLVDTVSALGGETDTLEGIARALGQIQAKGRAMQQEMNQLAERGVPALEILRRKLALSSAEVVDVGRSPKLGSGVVLKALMEGMEERFFGLSKKFMSTWFGQMERLKAWATEFKRVVMDSGPFEFMKTQVEKFLNFLDSPAGLDTISKWAMDLSKFILNVFQLIATLIKGIINSFVWISTQIVNIEERWSNKDAKAGGIQGWTGIDPNSEEFRKAYSKNKNIEEITQGKTGALFNTLSISRQKQHLQELKQYMDEFYEGPSTKDRLTNFQADFDKGIKIVEDFIRELETKAGDYRSIRDKFFAGGIFDATGIGDLGLISQGKSFKRRIDDLMGDPLTGEEGEKEKNRLLQDNLKMLQDPETQKALYLYMRALRTKGGESVLKLKMIDQKGKEIEISDFAKMMTGETKNKLPSGVGLPEDVKGKQEEFYKLIKPAVQARESARSLEEAQQTVEEVDKNLQKMVSTPYKLIIDYETPDEVVKEDVNALIETVQERQMTQKGTIDKQLFEKELNRINGLKAAYDEYLIFKQEGFTANIDDEQKAIMETEHLYRALSGVINDPEYIQVKQHKALWEIHQKFHGEEIESIKNRVHFLARSTDNEFDIERLNFAKRLAEARKYYAYLGIERDADLDLAKWVAQQNDALKERERQKAFEIGDEAKQSVARRSFLEPFDRHGGVRDVAGQVYDIEIEKNNKMKYLREEDVQAREDLEREYAGKYQDIQDGITDGMLDTWESAFSNMTSMMADFIDNGEWSWKKFASFATGALLDILKTFVETQVKMAAAERARMAASASSSGSGFNWGGLAGSLVSGLGGSMNFGGSSPAAQSLFSGTTYQGVTGIGMAGGGIIDEPILGSGLFSGKKYAFGEQGPEMVLNEEMLAGLGKSKEGNVLYNVNISTMDPRSMEDYFAKNPSLVLNRLHQAVQVGDKGTISTIKKASVR